MKFRKKNDAPAKDQELLEKKVDEMLYLDPYKKKSEEINDSSGNDPRVLKINIEPDPSDLKDLNNLADQIKQDQPNEVKTLKIEPLKLNSNDSSLADATPAGEQITSDPSQVNISSLDDLETDKAIDDIVAREGDEVLAVEDQAVFNISSKPQKKHKILGIFKNKWIVILLVIIILGIIAGIPYTRYKLLGLFMKSSYHIELIDNITKHPISGATVDIGGHNIISNANGQVDFKLPIGQYNIRVTKKYYDSYQSNILFGLSSNKKLDLYLHAYGRQFSFKFLNSITDQPISGASISYNNIKSTSNNSGIAYLVLPSQATSYNLTISGNGYNSRSTILKYSGQNMTASYRLTPSGRVYFLSQSQGTINVVSSNLDGTNQKVLIPGTSSEQASNTFLLASKDWKYLILEANMNGSGVGLYIIDTSTGKINEFDFSNSTFNLIGWTNNDQFIYNETNNSNTYSQSGNEQLKSYDAINQTLSTIAQNQVSGSGTSYAYQTFSNFNIIDNSLIYSVNWNNYNGYNLNSLSNTITQALFNGTGSNNLLSLNAENLSFNIINRPQPNILYISVINSQTYQTSYYLYSNGNVSLDTSINANNFNQVLRNYIFSLSGNNVIWNVQQNNHPVIFYSNQNSSNQKQLLIPSGYSVNSWYNDNYILVTSNNNLYITNINSSGQAPLLISPFLNLNSSS